MFTRSLLAFATVLAAAAPMTTVATEVTFTLDPAQSNVTFLADIFFERWFEQFPGSDTTSFSGTITVDVDDIFAPTQIEILGGSAVAPDYPTPMLPDPDPNNVTLLDPGNPAPAVYGLRITDTGAPGGVDTGFVTFRDLELSVTTNDDMGSSVLEPVDGSGNFSSLSLEFEAVSAIADAWITFFGGLHEDLGRTNPEGSESFRNDDPNNPPFPPPVGSWPESTDSSYVVSGNTATLSIVVNSHEDADELRDMYEGFLVGTVDLSPVFEADFNMDGVVNGDDFLIWQTGFLQFPGGDAQKSDGDADGDGIVDGNDFLVWQQEFAPGNGSGAVPEPSTFVLLSSVVVVAVLGRRRRRGH